MPPASSKPMLTSRSSIIKNFSAKSRKPPVLLGGGILGGSFQNVPRITLRGAIVGSGTAFQPSNDLFIQLPDVNGYHTKLERAVTKALAEFISNAVRILV